MTRKEKRTTIRNQSEPLDIRRLRLVPEKESEKRKQNVTG